MKTAADTVAAERNTIIRGQGLRVPILESWLRFSNIDLYLIDLNPTASHRLSLCCLLRALTKPAPGEERAAVWLCLTACQDFQTAGKPGVLRGDSLSLSPKLLFLLNNSKF